MTWREAMLAAFLATVGRGRWWIVALAGFLVRGGLLVLLPALLVIPTPAELATLVDPSLTGAAIGGISPGLVAIIVGAIGLAAIVVFATSLVGAWLEAGLIAEVAADEELEPVRRALVVPVLRALVVRLVAHLPTLVAVVLGVIAIGSATYAELVAPSGTDSLVGRVLAHAPLAVAAIVGCWFVGEAWAGLAARHIGRGDSLLRALVHGLLGIVRPSGLATLALSTVVVAAPAGALWLAVARAFERLWPLVVDRADPASVAIALVLLAGTWGAGLWLLAIALAWRSAAWTAEALRTA